MDVNSILHKSVKDLMDRGYSENKAWIEAYIRLVNDGVLTNPYISIKDDDPDVDYFYIFAHSTSDNQDYTYISAKYKNSSLPISIGLYDRFYDYLVNGISGDIEDGELKTDMLDGLSSLFGRICEDYVRQLDSELTNRLMVNEISRNKHCQYKEALLRGIADILEEDETKHISLDIDENENNTYTRGTFKVSNLSTDDMMVLLDIDHDTGMSIIRVLGFE